MFLEENSKMHLKNINILISYLKWWLHSGATHDNVLGRARHSLIGGRTKNIGNKLMLECIRSSICVLSSNVTSSVDLI